MSFSISSSIALRGMRVTLWASAYSFYSVFDIFFWGGGNADNKGIEFSPQTLFSNFNIIATQCRRPLIFQTMNDVRSKNGTLKYQRLKRYKAYKN